MMVYVNGQDIARLELGTHQEEMEVFEARPEDYLATFEAWLTAHKINRGDIEGFVIAKGPGSATALRTSHAMVNALAFALGVPVTSRDASGAHEPHAFALPVYAHDPNITKTKRDALKRKAV